MTENPRLETPNNDPAIHPSPSPSRSFAESLGDIVDAGRQLLTDFGLRPYRMFSIVERWSGGEEGRGILSTVSQLEFLPTPRIDLTTIRTKLDAGGTNEDGFHTVREISPRYTEDDIRSLMHVLPLPPGSIGYVEIRHDSRDGRTERRRYVVRGVPWRDAENFQWVASLSSQEKPRPRSGAAETPGLHRG